MEQMLMSQGALSVSQKFEVLEDILVAEEKLCAFDKFFKEFKQKEWQAIRSLAQEELEERHHASDDIFNRKKGGGVVSVGE